MNNILKRSIIGYDRLLNSSYHFIVGRKNISADINLFFTKKEFFHLAGLQYITDLPELNSDREKIYDLIFSDMEFCKRIEHSDNFSKIAERIEVLPDLEDLFDSNKTIFKFNNRSNSFSLIKADYILKNSDMAKNIYVFISREDKNSDTYFCRSAFPRDKSLKDYTQGHTLYTLLFKEKLFLTDGTKETLYSAPGYRTIK